MGQGCHARGREKIQEMSENVPEKILKKNRSVYRNVPDNSGHFQRKHPEFFQNFSGFVPDNFRKYPDVFRQKCPEISEEGLGMPCKRARNIPDAYAEVKLEKIAKGRIWGRLRASWRVCLKILPLHNSKEQVGKSNETPRTTCEQKLKTTCLFISCFCCFLCVDPR